MSFFSLAKVGAVLTEPANVLFLALLAAAVLLWRGRVRVARILVTLLAAGLGMLIFVPVGALLLQPLEQRFPMEPLPETVHGIVLLGGAQQPGLTAAHGQTHLNGRAERMNVFLILARRYPEAKLVASGGAGEDGEVNEALTTRVFLMEQGFDPARVMFEERSRNTHENALFSRRLAAPKAGETWLLVTSAADVPRAVGVFRKLSWEVLPVPCDYQVLAPDWRPSVSLLGELTLLDHALHEWLGLAVYYWTGRSASFFPGP